MNIQLCEKQIIRSLQDQYNVTPKDILPVNSWFDYYINQTGIVDHYYWYFENEPVTLAFRNSIKQPIFIGNLDIKFERGSTISGNNNLKIAFYNVRDIILSNAFYSNYYNIPIVNFASGTFNGEPFPAGSNQQANYTSELRPNNILGYLLDLHAICDVGATLQGTVFGFFRGYKVYFA